MPSPPTPKRSTSTGDKPAKKPSQYDNGETNWHSTTGSFEDWCRSEPPNRFVVDLRRRDDELPYYEPEFI